MRAVASTMQREGNLARAETPEDKLGWTVSFVRAAENVNLHQMRLCALAYPLLATYVPVEDPNARLHARMAQIKDHALQLAKESVTTELQELQRPASDVAAEGTYQQRKEHILTKLKRTLPGSTTSIAAMQVSDNCVTSDPDQIALALQQHWSKVFKREPIDAHLLRQWLQSLPGLSQRVARTIPTRRHCSKLIHNGIKQRSSAKSQPG